MSLADVLASLPGMAVERVIIGDETIILLAHLTAEAHPGPSCGTQAIRIHSRSRRTLLDLAVCGRQVRLSLQVRRFFCEDGSCPRTTFTLHKKQPLKAPVPEADLLPRALPLPIGGRAKATEEASLQWHSRLVERYHQIHERFAVGAARETIAAQLGINRKTVYRYLKMDQPPERPSPRDRRALPLERFKPYLLQRWNDGCRNAKQLWREIVAQGYGQSRSTEAGSLPRCARKPVSSTNSSAYRSPRCTAWKRCHNSPCPPCKRRICWRCSRAREAPGKSSI